MSQIPIGFLVNKKFFKLCNLELHRENIENMNGISVFSCYSYCHSSEKHSNMLWSLILRTRKKITSAVTLNLVPFLKASP